MKLSDAAHVLALAGNVTTEDVKLAYRRAARKYHPDKNPVGLDMMKMVNAAYELLKLFSGNLDEQGATSEGAKYTDDLSKALNAIMTLEGLVIEVCGAWVWVSGETKSHRLILKEEGFKYASKKKRWYFRPNDWVSSSRGTFSMDDIRDTYGSDKPTRTSRVAIGA